MNAGTNTPSYRTPPRRPLLAPTVREGTDPAAEIGEPAALVPSEPAPSIRDSHRWTLETIMERTASP